MIKFYMKFLSLNHLLLLACLLSSIIACHTLSPKDSTRNNTTIEGISIHYETNREVVDNYVWQEYILLRSDYPIASKKHRIELIHQQDTLPLYWFYNKPAQLEAVGNDLYQVVFRTKKEFETLDAYYTENVRKYKSFQLMIYFPDTLIQITNQEVKIDYVLDRDTLDWQTEQERIKNTSYQAW